MDKNDTLVTSDDFIKYRIEGLLSDADIAKTLRLYIKPCKINPHDCIKTHVDNMMLEAREAMEELVTGDLEHFDDKDYDMVNLQHLREELVDVATYAISILNALPGNSNNTKIENKYIQEMFDFVAIKNTIRGRVIR